MSCADPICNCSSPPRDIAGAALTEDGDAIESGIRELQRNGQLPSVLRACTDASCTLPHEHEAHDKQYDIRARLEKIAGILGERGSSRDMPKGERSMARAVRIFNAASGRDLSAADGWLFMICLKLSRRMTGKYKEDDYDDLCGYSVLFAEESAQENNKKAQGK